MEFETKTTDSKKCEGMREIIHVCAPAKNHAGMCSVYKKYRMLIVLNIDGGNFIIPIIE